LLADAGSGWETENLFEVALAMLLQAHFKCICSSCFMTLAAPTQYKNAVWA